MQDIPAGKYARTAVSRRSLTTAPPVTGSIGSPICRESSFSGIRPQDSSSVSHATYSPVPGMIRPFSSTRETVTPVTRSAP